MKRFLCLLPIFSLLCGCYPYTEIENMDVFTSLYADVQNEQIVLGGGIANVRSFSDAMAQTPVSLLYAKGNNLTDASQHLRQSADHELFYGALRAVVFGESLSQEGILPILRYLDVQPRLRRSTAVFITDADIESVVHYKAINDFSGGFAADSIITTLDKLGEMRYTSIGDVLYALTYPNAGHCIPHISLKNDLLHVDGYTIFSGDKAIGFTDNNAVTLFLCKNATLQQLYDGVPLSLQLTKKRIEPHVKDGELQVDVHFAFSLSQGKDVKILKSERLEDAKREIINNLHTQIEDMLRLVREKECDFLEIYLERQTQRRSDFDMQAWNAMLKAMTYNVDITIN